DSRFVQFPHVTALIKSAVWTRGVLKDANFCTKVRAADREVTIPRTAVVVEVGVVARIGQCVNWHCVGRASGGVVPIMVARTIVLMVGRLVPFILGRNKEFCAGIASKQRLVANVMIRAALSCSWPLRPGGLTVVEPVCKPRGVPEAHIVH